MAYSASAIMHSETCALHANDGPTMCSGTLKKGGNCTHRATGPPVPPMMPTCKLHQDQLRILGRCRERLPCGFECGRLFEWKPYGFQLCPIHREFMTTCYFLKMPTEMRLRVYQFLLPDKPIPARYCNSRALTTDGERVYTTILCVNHQIHDEVAGLLYGNTAFTIELSENNLCMCNSAKSFVRYGLSDRGNHALQDYQMQLLLLEQQSQRRIMMARQEQDNSNGGSSSTRSPPAQGIIQLHPNSFIPYEYMPTGPIWKPQLSDRYFNMIRSFIIEFVVLFPTASRVQNLVTHHAHGPPNVDAASYAKEMRLYDYCDNLHMLIGRLRLIQRPLAHLEIAIKLGHTYIELDDAFSATQLLLQPFRRLRNVAKPEARSITIRDFQDREIESLIPQGVFSTSDTTIADYVKCWSSNFSSTELSLEGSQVFEAYWQLEKLVSSIREQSHCVNTRFSQFSSLLHAARVAREAEDLASFREIWDQVVNIWFDYLNNQEGFQAQVARSIDVVYDIVGK